MEILLTTVIIGIIAVITIPVLIQRYVDRTTVSKVKKGLTILTQAKVMAEISHGYIIDWEYNTGATKNTAAQFWSYIRPAIAVDQSCGDKTTCYQSKGVFTLKGQYYSENFNTNNKYYKFAFADGSVMWFRMPTTGRCSSSYGGVNNVCAIFWYDVNGDKEPNTFGRDIFVYEMSKDGVHPNMTNDCNMLGDGMGCSSYIIKHGDLMYLH